MSEKEETEEENECVKVTGNEILFYGDVDRENALQFVDKFKKLEIELLKKKAELVGFEPTVRVHIMSDGGCIFSGREECDAASECQEATVKRRRGWQMAAAAAIELPYQSGAKHDSLRGSGAFDVCARSSPREGSRV